MLSRDPFEKFDLLPLSFSRVSSFINNKAQWYISYIHGYKSVSSAMERGTISEILSKVNNKEITLKGEFVLVIEPFSYTKFNFAIDKKIKKAFLEQMPAKDAAKLISLLTNDNKRDIYKQLIV